MTHPAGQHRTAPTPMTIEEARQLMAVRFRTSLAAREAFSTDDPLSGPAPCDDCKHAAQCGTERLACDAFALFVDGASRVRWGVAPRVAVATRFAQIFRVGTV